MVYFRSLQKKSLNYLNVENISKSFGELVLFKDLSFSIHKDQKIAFVAKNGSGKTSILNILSGKDTPDEGQIVAFPHMGGLQRVPASGIKQEVY